MRLVYVTLLTALMSFGVLSEVHAQFEGAVWDTLTSDTLRDASGRRTIRRANLFIIIGDVK